MQFHPTTVAQLEELLALGGANPSKYGQYGATSLESFLSDIIDKQISLSLSITSGRLVVTSTFIKIKIKEKSGEETNFHALVKDGYDIKAKIDELTAPRKFTVDKIIPCTRNITESSTYPGLVDEHQTLNFEFSA